MPGRKPDTTVLRRAHKQSSVGPRLPIQLQALPNGRAFTAYWLPPLPTAYCLLRYALRIDHPTRAARAGTPVGRASDKFVARNIKVL